GRLVLTLAYIAPIVPSRQSYRAAVLELDSSPSENLRLKEELDGPESRPYGAYTVQHIVRKGNTAPVVAEGDSLTVRISCRPDALNKTIYDPNDYPIRYALVATLEAKQQIDVQTYIRQRLRPRVRVRRLE
ncbi:MAG: hypothetical protein V3V10_01375, partial [Planctomycetota bacterium]